MSERETVPASLHEVPDSGAPRSAGQMLRELRESAGVDPALLASAISWCPRQMAKVGTPAA